MDLYSLLIGNFKPGDIIRNWTPYRGYQGNALIVKEIKENSILLIFSENQKKEINVPFYELEGLLKLWPKILSGEITRHQYTHKTPEVESSPFYFSRYCLDILKVLNDKGYI